MVALPLVREPDDVEPDDDLPTRPKTRGDCVDGPRPCPWASCKYHLTIHPQDNGSLAMRGLVGVLRAYDLSRGAAHPEDVRSFIARAVDDVMSGRPSCALDLADEGDHTLEEVGEALWLTRERVRQIEVRALSALRHPTRRAHLGSASVAHDGIHVWTEAPDEDDGE